MADAAPRARIFRYANPGAGAIKTVVKLARTDRMMAAVHVLKSGGENNLHSHLHLDGFWFVLKGRATFYGEGDKVLAEVGPHEGILIPRTFRYWFESSGDEELELLQVEAFDVAIPHEEDIVKDRTNFTEIKPSFTRVNLVDADGRLSD